jgi:hypothetical protein
MAKSKGTSRRAAKGARKTAAARPARGSRASRTAGRAAGARPKAKAKAKAAKGRTAVKRSAAKRAPKRPIRMTKPAARKTAARKAVAKRTVAKRAAGKKPGATKRAATKAAPKRTMKAAAPASKAPMRPAAKPKPVSTPDTAVPRLRRAPTLDRERRRVTEADLPPSPPSSLNMDRSASAARSGRADLVQKLQKHTSTGPVMTSGDVDADWEAAEAVGDEAPGGDNPTPDQDVVDDIGKALGVEYDDDEELQGGDEIVDRDRNRWELDPASKDDFEDE